MSKPRLVQVIINDASKDPRVMKVIRWGVANGFACHVVQGFRPHPDGERTVLWQAGHVLGEHIWPVTSWCANEASATLLLPAVMELRPDVLYAQELTALYPLCADWSDSGAIETLTRLSREPMKWSDSGVKFKRPPVRRFVYDVHEYERERSGYEHVGAELGWIEDQCVPLVDYCITTGPTQAELLQGHTGHPRVGWTANGPVVGLSEEEQKQAREAVRAEFGIGGDEAVVGWCGHIGARRSLDRIVRAVEMIAGARLLVVGAGVPEIEAELRANPRVIMAGHRRSPLVREMLPDSLVWVLAAADVGVSILPNDIVNHRVASPNKVWEYSAAGLPIVCNNQPDAECTERPVIRTPGSDPTAAELAAAIAAAVEQSVDEPWTGWRGPDWACPWDIRGGVVMWDDAGGDLVMREACAPGR